MAESSRCSSYAWNLENPMHQDAARPVPIEGSEYEMDVDTVIACHWNVSESTYQEYYTRS